MKIWTRPTLYLILGGVFIWFLYLERDILTPFISAAIFAYILNPLITFFNERLRLPRALSIVIVYLVLITGFVVLGTIGARRLIAEADELIEETEMLLKNAESSIIILPDFLQVFARESLSQAKSLIQPDPSSIFPFFSGVVSKFVSLFVFLFSAFYFLKEGGKIFDKLSYLIPNEYRIDISILGKKINQTLGNYLRSEILIILIMAILYFIVLSVLGVRFALLLAVFGGVMEIIPVIGPIIAGGVAVAVAVFDGTSKFNMPVLYEGTAIAISYFVLNQLESYLIIPNLMGKLIKLHPLIIVFAVLAGGHSFGILGIILAVPVAASLRILLEFALDKLA